MKSSTRLFYSIIKNILSFPTYFPFIKHGIIYFKSFLKTIVKHAKAVEIKYNQLMFSRKQVTEEAIIT